MKLLRTWRELSVRQRIGLFTIIDASLLLMVASTVDSLLWRLVWLLVSAAGLTLGMWLVDRPPSPKE